MKKLALLAAVGALGQTACTPDLDFNVDKYENVVYRGNWAVPVAVVSFGLENLIIDDSSFVVDPDGGIRIIYEEDSLIEYSLSDFATVPEQDPVETDIPMGVPFISISSGLGTLGGAKFKTISLDDGLLTLTTTNNLTAQVEIKVRIDNGTLAGQPFEVLLNAPVGIHTTSVSLNDMVLDLSNGGTTHNYLSFRIDILNNGGAQASDNIKLSLKYENIRFKEAVGYFGQRSISVPSGSFDMQMGGLENYMTGLYLANPQARLAITTNIGLPLELDVNLSGINKENNLVELGLNEINIDGPLTVGQTETDTIVVDNTTSNIVGFIANVPSAILYGGSATMNPQGETGIDNFVTADGKVRLGVRLDLPLEIRSKDLKFKHTLNDKLIDLENSEETEAVEELALYFSVKNEFPIAANLKLRFYNGTMLTDSVVVELFEAADVDGQGRSTGHAHSTEKLVVDSDKIKHILESTKTEIEVTLNTSNGGTTTVKIYDDYDIEVALGVKIKLNYEL